ncbi:MAG: type II secretory pathway protein [Proteobacteria bacterium]|nr:MAG: type II secretory pathway protein [Pseudomonadota bacterium]PIE68120.1 MAG: type II secretory pathway protein [Deltaproteobacteria bacterium]
MYLDHYHLRLKPFQISTDPQFLWLGEKHEEALAVLKYGVLDNKGFLLLTGDVGTGKTTLLNALIDSLGDDTLVALVTDPGLAKMDFFNFVADSFEMDKSFKTKGEFLIYLRNYLHHIHQQNRRTLLIIDECQHLNQKLLEEVRLLSNIEKSNTKLINIFFVGQSEFNDIILRPRNRAIRQRITVNYNISALTASETAEYIRFRLDVAGGAPALFTSGAIKQVYQFSNGYPRLINIICDQALLTGYVREQKHIDHKIIAECAAELKISGGTTHRKNLATPEGAAHPGPQAAKGDERQLDDRESKGSDPLNRILPIILTIVVILCMGLAAVLALSRLPGDKETLPITVEPKKTIQEKVAKVSDPPNDDVATKQSVNASVKNPVPGDSGPDTDTNTLLEPVSPGNENLPAKITTPGPETIRETPDKIILLSAITERFGAYPEILFDFNSNTLDASDYEKLDIIAQFCSQHPQTRLVLRGYTDKSGVRAYNIKLSEFRATMVKTYLVGRGVKDSAIKTIAVGPDQDGPAGMTVPYDGKRRKVLIEILATTLAE